mgnify:CR=1 FL=1
MHSLAMLHKHPLLRAIRYASACYLLYILLMAAGKYMLSQIIYDNCELLAKEVMSGTEEQVSTMKGTLISFKNAQKTSFIPGKALMCTADFQGTGGMPSGTYKIAKDRKAVYWSTQTYQSPGSEDQ